MTKVMHNYDKVSRNMRILDLAGTPRQRGQVHGEQLRTEIATVLAGWQLDIERSTRQPVGPYIERFLTETDFLPAIERWTPGLLAEVEGIAEGANQPFETVLALQFMDEDWWFRESISPREHCSGFGIFGQGAAPILAQNMDIHTLTDGYQTLLHIQHDGFESYVFSFAGFIGLTGLNSRPVGICCNTLSQLNYAPDGLPVAFIVRGVLEQPDLDAAEKFLRSIRHASGQNYRRRPGRNPRFRMFGQ
jgi:isopenicillin-N N-acyltransferase like protein